MEVEPMRFCKCFFFTLVSPPEGKANLASLAKTCSELRSLTVNSKEEALYQHQTDNFLQLAVALPRLASLTIQAGLWNRFRIRIRN